MKNINGSPTAFKNNDIMYYYVKNLQGDIVKIVKQDGSVAATYTYDAWGKLLSVKDGSNVNVPASKPFHVANLNPYRYRGYIYDTETGLYYLQSRYYDPITGRFLNADDMQFLIKCDNVLAGNLFNYCANNAVNNADPKGEFWLTLAYKAVISFITVGLGISLIYTAISVVSSIYNFFYNQQFKFNDYIVGQGSGNAAKVRMGLFTGDFNGCAWIATFNALKALGEKNINHTNIISYFELYGCVLQGLFGVLPDAVADYFRFLGYCHVDEICFPGDLDSIIYKYRATILFYAHSGGCHYIMVKYLCGLYYAYNVYNDSSEIQYWNSVDKEKKNRNYNVLYFIGIK